MSATRDLSVVIPLLNEEESLVELHNRIVAVTTQQNYSYEIIFIDDGSTDSSAQIIEELATKNENVKLLQFRSNYGKAAGLTAGFEKASGKFIITMDADLQDDPDEIPKLIEKLEEGYDLVSGWKKVRHDPFIKRHTSKIYNYFTSVFSGLRLHDFNCGLKAYRYDVVKSIKIYGELHRYLPVIAFKNGFKVTEMVVKHHARKYGVSKYGLARFTRGAFDLLTITFLTRYKKRPLHLFGLWGLISFFFGFVLLTYLVYERIFHNAYLSNRPILFLGVLLIIIGVQFFSIGLLGEMITSSRPESDTFFVRKTIGFDE